ncbi:MAG: hypothetical protein PQJ46_07395 [Spirochaetales bacterium]|nr:hypothetical protein [Spirochaetales bacterium]
MKKKYLLILFILPLLSSCFSVDKRTAILSTNIPEVAAYVELFNASQTTYKVELVYTENPSDLQNLTSDSAPDIVIGENLASPSIITAFSSEKRLIDRNLIDPGIFYEELFKLCCIDEEPHVFPVSFNVPAIIFNKGTLGTSINNNIITPEQLKEAEEAFNNLNSGNFRTMGFSPLWEPQFIIDCANINGADFTINEDERLSWNNDKLTESINFCKEITEKDNSGFEAENDFTITYCYDPGYKLINSGRIGFYYTTLKDFYSIPSDDRATLILKWFGDSSNIPVKGNIVFTGIPSKSEKKKAAKAFLLWFLDSDSQKEMMESANFKRMHGFGICGGLSAIPKVNKLVFPTYYRRLIGNVPPEQYLSFPKKLPPYWDKICDEAIIPWIKDQISQKQETVKLSETVETWILQHKKNK